MSEIQASIARLEKIRDRLTDPSEFYREVQQPWTDLAKRIVEQTLAAIQPAGIDPEQWQAKIAGISRRVAVTFLGGDEIGLLLEISPRPGTSLDLTDAKRFTLGNLSIQDVEEWVNKGRDKASPEDPGKNLTEIDQGKSDLQIAWRVMYALKLQKPGWERLLDVLRDFVGLEAEEIADAAYPELLKAWLEHFSVRAVDDWRAHVSRVVNNGS